MESTLVSKKSVILNLRRTSSKGLFSCLSQHQLNDLAIKYFGIYDNNKIVGYECPYSGKKITNVKNLVLEHIIPVCSGGGTTLFNCIPTSVEVNSFSEKGSKHLISWWLNSKYWNSSASFRLEKIIEYILEAYEITFINGEEVSDNDDFDYDENENNINSENTEGDLSTTQEEEQNVESTSLIIYYDFINELINVLEKCKNNQNVPSYQNRLQDLINQNIFENIERQTLIQNSLKDIIKTKLELEDRSELTLVQKIDISMMTKSLENVKDVNIYSELEQRIDNLDIILQNYNLGLNSLFMDKNSINYLYKNTSNLTDEEIKQLVENINMCVEDKVNAMIQFVIDRNGSLPSRSKDSDENEQQLARFLSSIKSIDKKTGKFKTQLTKNQLKYLHDLEYESLRDVYKEILFKAIENDILIEYIDDEMASKIREYNELLKNTNSVEEQINLKNVYKEYIIIESQFNQFIDFVINKEPKGELPSHSKNADENEQQLASFISNIKTISKKTGKFSTQLTKNQLKYLHDSEYESLRDVYKEILYKAIENDILIEYIDEEMALKIREYKELLKNSNSIENQIELERKYVDYIIIESQFNQFIDFVINKEPKGELSSHSKNADENEQQLASFISCIKTIYKKRGKFSTQLTKNQLKYLHDSEYKSLRDVYKEILFKAIENDILIEYVDDEMASKIREYNELLKNTNLVEEQIKLENKYRDYIIIESQFNQLINFILNIEPKGILPSQSTKVDESEQQLAQFLHNIKIINKKTGKFNTQLTENQLKYLHDSEYDSLRDVYKEILFKAIENDIEIEYVDEEMELKIREYNELLKNSNSIEEQIELESKYTDYIIIESQFNQFIDFVINKEPKGELPSHSKNADENEQQLASLISHIKTINKKRGKFKTQLTKNQLKYLHDSEYDSLRDVYKEILFKAIENDVLIEYVDDEMASKIREYNELLKNTNSIEEQIGLENKYTDYIIIESQFNQFIDFVINKEPKGKLPSLEKESNKYNQNLANYLQRIKVINKKTGKFIIQLTKNQLKYLHDLEYKSLRDVYKEILFKAIENDIEIEYVDEEMASKIREYNELLKNSNSIENQIELERKYADYIIIESQFNHFIDFVLNIEPKGKLPSRLKDADENEQQLAYFILSIKSIDKKTGKFKTQLTKEQLEYLHYSEYESLRKIYDEIIEKAIAIHYQPYIEVDNELKNSRKGKVA